MVQSDQSDERALAIVRASGVAACDASFNDGLGDEYDDGLLDVICDIETKLEALRDTHLEQHRLEVELIEHDQQLCASQQSIETRERALGRQHEAIVARARAMTAEQDELVRERAMLDQQLAELDDRVRAIDAHERDQAALSDEVRAERAQLAQTREQIAQQTAGLAGRSAALETQAQQLACEQDELAQTRASLERDRAELNELAAAQQAEAAALEALRSDLAQRERELAERAEAHATIRDEFAALSAQLEAIRAEASEHATPAAAKPSSEERAEQLERRVRAIEQERQRMETELARTRRDMRTGVVREAPAVELAVQATPGVQAATRRRTGLLAAIWLLSVAVAIGAVVLGVVAEMPLLAVGVLGVVFAGAFFAVHAVAGRLMDPMALPVGLFGGTFGLWFPRWVGSLETALATWEIPQGLVPVSMVPGLPLGLGVATASLALAIGLYLLTGSGRLLGQTLFASVVTTALMLMPDPSHFAVAAGAVLWTAMVAAALAHWAIGTTPRQVVLGPGRSMPGGGTRPL